MDFESKYWHLIHFNLSKRLSKDEMIHLCSTLVMKHFKKGDQVGLAHDITNDVYFLKKGTIKIVSLQANGEEIIKDVVKEGDIFGILGLLSGESQDDYAVALEDSLVCIIDAIYLKKMMKENLSLNNQIFKLAGTRIKKLERKLESMLYKDAKTRVVEFMVDYVEEFGTETEEAIVAKNLLSNSDIGKITSTSRQTVNKTLNSLKTDNLIDFDKNIIKANKNILHKLINNKRKIQ